MILSTLNSPAVKNLIAHMPIVILFKAVREALVTGKATKPARGSSLPSASFR